MILGGLGFPRAFSEAILEDLEAGSLGEVADDGKRASSAIEVESQAARPLGEGLGGGASAGLGAVTRI